MPEIGIRNIPAHRFSLDPDGPCPPESGHGLARFHSENGSGITIARSSNPERSVSHTINRMMITNGAQSAFTNGHEIKPIPSGQSSPSPYGKDHDHPRAVTAFTGTDQVRSEDRSGLTRHRIPASPRGYRDTVSNCDHQPMQRTYREPQDRARPAGSGQTVSIWQRSRPPESGHSLNRIRSVLKADRVRFGRQFLQPRGADGPSCRNAATGTHNAYTNARVIKPVPSARAGSDRYQE
jgi:hypothetical protein